MSVRDEIIQIYLNNKLIDSIMKLLENSKTNGFHPFCLEFGSGLLANMFHSSSTLNFYEENFEECKNVIIC
jgi:hypothetical protein